MGVPERVWMFLCLCYVYMQPTARAPPGVKAKFYSELQDALVGGSRNSGLRKMWRN